MQVDVLARWDLSARGIVGLRIGIAIVRMTLMNTASSPQPTEGPLGPQHHVALATANKRARKIRTAAGVAAFNGWGTAVLAACSAPFALFSILGCLVLLGLTVVAYNEFHGRQRLLLFDPAAARLLGWNQLGFLGLIVAYCAWMLCTGLTSANPIAAEMAHNLDLERTLGSMGQVDYLYRATVVVFYGTVIFLALIFQGLNAVYYFTRRKYVVSYLAETPDWVMEVLRTTARTR
jgi:hypothetical protein